MKNTRHFALSAVVSAALAASCQCSKPSTPPRVEVPAGQSYDLPNGLAVDLAPGPCGDSASLAVLVQGGVDHDPAGRSGMARVAERLLAARKGSVAEAGTDFTLYSVAASREGLAAELDSVAAWMKAAPAEADFAAAKSSVLDGLKAVDASGTAVGLAEESVQPTAGAGKRRGIRSEVEAISFAELQSFWQDRFRPGNARLVVAGGFDVQAVRSRVDALFAALPAGKPPVAREANGSTVRGTLVMSKEPSAVLAVAVPAPALSDPLYPAFLVQAARLLQDPPAPRTWQARFDPVLRPGLLLVTSTIHPTEQPEPAADRVRAEVGAVLARPLAPADLAAAKGRFGLFLAPTLDEATCAQKVRDFAVARARRAQLGLEKSALAQSLDALREEELAQAAKLFDPARTAAVIASEAR